MADNRSIVALKGISLQRKQVLVNALSSVVEVALSGVILFFVSANTLVYATWNTYKSPKPVGDKIRELTSTGIPWVFYGSMRGVYVYYAGKQAIHVDEHDVEGLKALGRTKPAFYVLARKRDFADLSENLKSVTIVSEQRVGDTPMVIARYNALK